jgi:membrane-associated phospholipid phosphatase
MAPGVLLQATVDAWTLGFGLVTQLGDTWFLALLAVSLYWLGRDAPVVGPHVDRDRAAVLLGLLLLAFALTTGLKARFAVERPVGGLFAPTVPDPTVESLLAWLAGANGYGFPSGHGVLATAGWGGLAWAVRRGHRRARVAVAGAVIVVVGVSRVALTLHTPWQVLAGAIVGAAALAAVLALRRPLRAGTLALAASVVGLLAVGLVHELLVVAGLSAGIVLAWYRVGGRVQESDAGALSLAIGVPTVLPAVAGLLVLTVSPVAILATSTVTGAALVALPLVGTWLDEKRVNGADRT